MSHTSDAIKQALVATTVVLFTMPAAFATSGDNIDHNAPKPSLITTSAERALHLELYLGMPGMTMVFRVKDAAMLDKVQVGSKVLFAAESNGGAITVTTLELAK